MRAATKIRGVIILSIQHVNLLYDLLRKRFCPSASLSATNVDDTKQVIKINVPGHPSITLNKTTYPHLMTTLKLLERVGHAIPTSSCLEQNLKSGLSYEVTQV